MAIIAFSAVRAIVRGYVPLDDNAIVETRARDVLSGRIPFVGTVSSASRSGALVHHPGPMLFDLLALPVRMLPHGAGVALGAALINIASVITLAWCARRALGDGGACIVVAAVAGLMWSLGSEALFEVWQPIVTLLPLLLALVSSWGWASGHDEMAVPMVLAVSFIVQSHGSYLLIGPALVVVAVCCRVTDRRTMTLRRRPLLLAGGLGVIVWMQPLIDQLFRTRNLSAILARASSDGDRALGIANGIRAAAMVLVRPPWWTRPGVDRALPIGGGFVSDERGRVFDPDWLPLPIAAGGIAVVLGGLGACAVLGRRRRDRVLVSGAVMGLTVVVAALASLSRLPVDSFGFTAHKARWLWPIGAYLTAFGLVALLRLDVPRSPRAAVTSMCLVGGVALAATVPTSYQLLSPAQYEVGSQDAARRLRDAVGALAGRGIVLLDLSGRSFPDPYNDTVAAEMTARGISYRVTGEYLVGQYGDGRRLDGASRVDLTARIFVGQEASAVPESWEVVTVLVDGPQAVVFAVTDGLVLPDPAPSG